MADKKKGKSRKKGEVATDDDKVSDVEYSVAKYLRSKLPEKKNMLMGHKVEYFIASKAVDCLLESEWAVKKEKGPEAIFTTRESVVAFMDKMLRHKIFHRAEAVVVIQKTSESKKSKSSKSTDQHSDDEKKDHKKSSSKTPADGQKDSSKVDNSENESSKTASKPPKAKKKIKLDMHFEQIFVDAKEPYVWIYDPIPIKAWFIGLFIVVAAVLICLFPLWPRVVRTYVYYLSVAAAGFLFFIIALAILRYIVFGIIWGLTLGRHHFWMLPNLTEDVGFWASFWPLYTYKYNGPEEEPEKTIATDGKESKKED